MNRCIIVDDERNARESLGKMIQRYFRNRVEVVGLASSVKEAVALIRDKQPQLVFLDIEMPEENGMQLFSHFQNPEFKVIFTTAYEQYALSAIKLSALDYLLKPIGQIELEEAIGKFEAQEQVHKVSGLQIESLLHNLNHNSEDSPKIVLPNAEGYEMVKIRNITYCKADGNYCELNTVDNEVILVSKPLKYVEDLLPDNIFFRSHKSYLINLNYIKSISRNSGGVVVLDSGDAVPIATKNLKRLLQKVQNS